MQISPYSGQLFFAQYGQAAKGRGSPAPATSSSDNPQVPVANERHTPATDNGSMADRKRSGPTGNQGRIESALSEAELKQVRELKARDREVRAHERAHAAVAGALARGGPSFDYHRGPDGVLYAVGGEVEIDTTPVSGDPEATIDKARRIRRAALAPAEPSAQDRAVAAQAAAMEAKARAELKNGDTHDPKGTGRVEESPASDKTHEAGYGSAAKTKADSEAQPESEFGCAICGGGHSAESHVSDVEHQLNRAFSVAALDPAPETLARTGRLIKISV